MNMEEMTFGVEFECIVPNNLEADLPRGGYHHGERSRILPPNWEGRWDRSIQEEPGTYTLEIVSPILSGINGFNQIAQVLSVLNSLGVHVNESCGFHVHVGASEMTRLHVKLVKDVFIHFEAAFFGQCGSQAFERLTGRGWEYCKTAPAWRYG
jgi:hypothetical protein